MPQAVDDFLKTVLRSGLLTRDELQESLRTVPKERRDDAQALADHLVKAGKLSRFQAAKLRKGTAMGLILGPYQVLAPIGKGGMGMVYLARDARSKDLVALKVLPPKKAQTEERLLARFLREMELSQRVAHPNLTRTFQAGQEEGVYYLAMEFIAGKSLSRLVHQEGPFSVPRAAHLFAEVCAGLEHAHAQGLIHRDLKPSNIMVTPNDHAKLLDLGLALIQGEDNEEREVIGGRGYIVGSMDYIAPEQTEDAARVDARSDLYALGCTIYYTVTGRPPFPGGTPREKIQKHRQEAPPPLVLLNPNVPQNFAALVHRLMAKAPEQRFASAAEVRQHLLAWAPAAPDLPLDRQSDQEYQRAVTVLAETEAPSELLAASIIPAGEVSVVPTPTADGAQNYLWIGVAMIGFWVLLLVILGLIVLLR